MDQIPVFIESEHASHTSLTQLAHITEEAMKISRNARALNTLNGYASAWKDFENWCKNHQLQSLPTSPSVVVAYLSDRALNFWVGPTGRIKQMAKKPPLKLQTLLHRL